MRTITVTHLDGTTIAVPAQRVSLETGHVVLERSVGTAGSHPRTRWRAVLRMPLSTVRDIDGLSTRTFLSRQVPALPR